MQSRSDEHRRGLKNLGRLILLHLCESEIHFFSRGLVCVFVRSAYVCRQEVAPTTGYLGDRCEQTSRWAESRADTGTRWCRDIQSSPRSPGRSQCLLGFRSGQLKGTEAQGIMGNTPLKTHFLFCKWHKCMSTKFLVRTFFFDIFTPVLKYFSRQCVKI